MNIRCHACKSTDIKKVTAIISQGSKGIKLGHGFVGAARGGGLGGALGKTGGSIESDLAKKLKGRKPSFGGFPMFCFTVLIVPLIIFWSDLGFFNTKTIGTIVLMTLFFTWFAKSQNKEGAALEEFNNEWYCFKCGEISLTPGFLKKREEEKLKLIEEKLKLIEEEKLKLIEEKKKKNF